MRCLVAGTPEVAVVALRAICSSDHEVIGVLTRPAAQTGRGRRVQASPVAQFAEELGLPVLAPERLSEPGFQEVIRQMQPDCCPVIAFGGLIPPELLDLPKHGWINEHFSLLPAWRGAAPVNYALMAGDAQTGVTTFRIEEGLDTGPILKQRSHIISPRDTAGSLLEALSSLGAQLLVETLDELAAGSVSAQPQPSTGISVAPRLRTEQARVDWSHSAAVIDRLVRAMTPAPGAWTQVLDQEDHARVHRLNIGPVEPDVPLDVPLDVQGDLQRGALAPGQVIARGQHVWVGTGDNPVRLSQVQPAGKRWMTAAEWLRGLRGHMPTFRFDDAGD